MNIVTPSFGLLHFYTAWWTFAFRLKRNPRTSAPRPEQAEALLDRCFSANRRWCRIFPGVEPESTFLCPNGTGSHRRAPGLDSDAGEVRGDLSRQNVMFQ